MVLCPPLQEFEAKYSERKASYDSVVQTYESRTAALEQEVSGLHTEVGGRVRDVVRGEGVTSMTATALFQQKT